MIMRLPIVVLFMVIIPQANSQASEQLVCREPLEQTFQLWGSDNGAAIAHFVFVTPVKGWYGLSTCGNNFDTAIIIHAGTVDVYPIDNDVCGHQSLGERIRDSSEWDAGQVVNISVSAPNSQLGQVGTLSVSCPVICGDITLTFGRVSDDGLHVETNYTFMMAKNGYYGVSSCNIPYPTHLSSGRSVYDSNSCGVHGEGEDIAYSIRVLPLTSPAVLSEVQVSVPIANASVGDPVSLRITCPQTLECSVEAEITQDASYVFEASQDGEYTVGTCETNFPTMIHITNDVWPAGKWLTQSMCGQRNQMYTNTYAKGDITYLWVRPTSDASAQRPNGKIRTNLECPTLPPTTMTPSSSPIISPSSTPITSPSSLPITSPSSTPITSPSSTPTLARACVGVDMPDAQCDLVVQTYRDCGNDEWKICSKTCCELRIAPTSLRTSPAPTTTALPTSCDDDDQDEGGDAESCLSDVLTVDDCAGNVRLSCPRRCCELESASSTIRNTMPPSLDLQPPLSTQPRTQSSSPSSSSTAHPSSTPSLSPATKHPTVTSTSTSTSTPRASTSTPRTSTSTFSTTTSTSTSTSLSTTMSSLTSLTSAISMTTTAQALLTLPTPNPPVGGIPPSKTPPAPTTVATTPIPVRGEPTPTPPTTTILRPSTQPTRTPSQSPTSLVPTITIVGTVDSHSAHTPTYVIVIVIVVLLIVLVSVLVVLILVFKRVTSTNRGETFAFENPIYEHAPLPTNSIVMQSHNTASHNIQPHNTQSHNTQSHNTQSHNTQSHNTQSHNTQSHNTQSHNTQSHNTQSPSHGVAVKDQDAVTSCAVNDNHEDDLAYSTFPPEPKPAHRGVSDATRIHQGLTSGGYLDVAPVDDWGCTDTEEDA